MATVKHACKLCIAKSPILTKSPILSWREPKSCEIQLLVFFAIYLFTCGNPSALQDKYGPKNANIDLQLKSPVKPFMFTAS